MARRTVGILCLVLGVIVLLIVLNGMSAPLLLRIALVALVGAIVYFYSSGNIFGWQPNKEEAAHVEIQHGQTEGVFDTHLPDEAFLEPEIETKMVNLSRSDAGATSMLTKEYEHHNVAQPTATLPLFEDSTDEPKLELTQEREPVFPQESLQAQEPLQADESPASVTALEPKTEPGQIVSASEPIFLELEKYSNEELASVVRDGEKTLINTLTDTGLLSTEGPLSETDVNTMVFVAVSSDDLLRALLEGKAAEEDAKALSHPPDTPELYQPAVELVEVVS